MADYFTPFGAGSLWNSFPLAPKFGTYQIPPLATGYFPAIGESMSVKCFCSAETDPPMQVFGYSGSPSAILTTGPSDPDSGGHPVITVPHWPADVAPAAGTDGHCDIYDEAASVIHSFWALKQINGVWGALLYSWSPINGSGWGDGAHFYQGARAAGVVPSAGLIRSQEISDGEPMFYHALCMSLDASAMQMPFVFPATSQDGNAATKYKGQIPMGSRMMLPPDFDYMSIANLDLRKVARTLMVYGAYVVDTNFGTPFAIYVEIGGGYNLMPAGWNQTVANQLMSIANALRVAQSDVYVPGRPFTPNKKVNLLSMRGPWTLAAGPQLGVYDSWKQALVFPSTTTQIKQSQTNRTEFHDLPWLALTAGKQYAFKVTATGGAMLNLQFFDPTWHVIYQTGDVANGASVVFTAPSDVTRPSLYAKSGVGAGSTVSATLIEQ